MLRKPVVTTSEQAVSRRFPFGLTLLFLLCFGVLIALGVWQLKRLAWKEDLLARIAALQTAPAQPLTAVLARSAAGQDADFTRVEVDCPGLAKADFIELYALRDGQAGQRIISACAIDAAGYASILVDRGYVADTTSARPPVDKSDRTPIHIVGVLRQADKRNFAAPPDSPQTRKFYTRDAAAMAPLLAASKPAPLFLFAETSTNPQWPALVPAPVPPEISNRHMEYVLTWFGLAATLACVYAAMLWRRLRV